MIVSSLCCAYPVIIVTSIHPFNLVRTTYIVRLWCLDHGSARRQVLQDHKLNFKADNTPSTYTDIHDTGRSI